MESHICDTSGATGLEMWAWIFGFCRKIADNNVEPERGKPEMK